MARSNTMRHARRELGRRRAAHTLEMAQLAAQGVRKVRLLRYLALAVALGTASLFGRVAVEAATLASVYHVPKPPAVTLMAVSAAALGAFARMTDRRAAKLQDALAARARAA